ncbi:MAG: hypothetical protein K6U74_16780, partial [Firmicutes bacterium]|nr:hypothetical protein [Bacillota bacterium]
AISMSSKRNILEIHTKEESLRTWVGDERPDFEGLKSVSEQLPEVQLDVVELSDQAKALQAKDKGASEEVRAGQTIEIEISDREKQKILMLQRMIEALTGKKFKFYVPKKLKLNALQIDLNFKGIQSPRSVGWGLEYECHEFHYEREKMSFASEGIIRTADGREINFSVQLKMSREFASRQDIRITAGTAAIDPLVINFSGAAPELTDTKFNFDLDSDGKADRISFVSPGSGFLALDLNSDGRINNGGELFGPKSGNGFIELAQYDEDGNNWIDENDSIYERLRIWTKDSEGRDVLFALGEKGIGAIFTGNISTPFDIKNPENKLQGQVRKSGIFVGENGSAGTVQQIDLTI